MSKPNTQRAMKRKAARKAHNKAIQSEIARREGQSNKKAKKGYQSCKDLVHGLINDVMTLNSNIETIRIICQRRIEQINELKAKAPGKFDALDTKGFDEALVQIQGLHDIIVKLLTAAGTLEDMEKNDGSMEKMMEVFSNAIQSLTDLEVSYASIQESMQRANTAFNDTTGNGERTAEKSLGETTEELFEQETPTEVDPALEKDENGHVVYWTARSGQIGMSSLPPTTPEWKANENQFDLNPEFRVIAPGEEIEFKDVKIPEGLAVSVDVFTKVTYVSAGLRTSHTEKEDGVFESITWSYISAAKNAPRGASFDVAAVFTLLDKNGEKTDVVITKFYRMSVAGEAEVDTTEA